MTCWPFYGKEEAKHTVMPEISIHCCAWTYLQPVCKDVRPHVAFEIISTPVEQRSYWPDLYGLVGGCLLFATIIYLHCITYIQEPSGHNCTIRVNWRKHMDMGSQKLVVATLSLVINKALKILAQRQDSRPQSSKILFFLRIYLLYVYEYTVAICRHIRRGHWIPLQMAVSPSDSLEGEGTVPGHRQ